jgi:hypothetical protein
LSKRSELGDNLLINALVGAPAGGRWAGGVPVLASSLSPPLLPSVYSHCFTSPCPLFLSVIFITLSFPLLLSSGFSFSKTLVYIYAKKYVGPQFNTLIAPLPFNYIPSTLFPHTSTQSCVPRPVPLSPGASMSALLNAVAKGDLESAKRLVVEGSDVKERHVYGYTPLLLAAHYGNIPIMIWLLTEVGSSLVEKDVRGAQALLISAGMGCFAAMQYLLEKQGASITELRVMIGA